MPVDPFAVLNALLRAEAARQERSGHPATTEHEPERTPLRAAPGPAAEPEPTAD
ncbi:MULTISPECIES: hypothetical protein [unclassified Streptomyces]|uniref:hypothetical protein n=1 Tax=unclassified Streptomyces TaxID=2593676 RepID=UPI002E312502|nr:hypothetical protein [Streptomyces sp. NBC_01268]